MTFTQSHKQSAFQRRAEGAKAKETKDRLQSNNTTKFYDGFGHVVGTLRGDTFYKSVYGSRHMLRKPQAWALDKQALEDAKRAGAVYVQIVDNETGVIYRAAVSHVLENGFDLNRGYGSQIALPLAGWTRHTKSRSLPTQLDLFGVTQ